MSESEQPCIRGCVRDCRCDACLTAPAPVHDPVPLPAVDGHLCRTCSNKLARWLSTILEDTLTLSTRIPDDYALDHGHTRMKVSGSPALSRLDVLALTDPRTTITVEDEAGRGKRPDPADYDENDSGILQIPAVIIQRAQDLKDEHDLASPNTNMREAVTLLTNQWDRLTASDWIDEFYDDMATIRQLLNRAHQRKPPLPRGHCFTCNTQLWQEDGNGQDTVTCPKCQRIYDHLGLVKLKLQRDRERA